MTDRTFENVKLMRMPDEKDGKVLKRFQRIVENKYQIKFGNFWDFHKWTLDHIVEFWAEMWDFTGIISSTKSDKVIDLNIPMCDSPEWFPGARLNYAENLLKYRGDDTALILTGEDRESEKVTFAQMYEEAKQYAAAFRKLGLKKGDRVACYMPNRKEPVFAMIGAISIGSIWTGALPLLDPKAVLFRLQQVTPKVLLTVDRFMYNGQEIKMLNKVKEIADGLPTLKMVIIVATKEETKSMDIGFIKNSCFLEEFLLLAQEADGSVPPMEFEQVSMSHPVYINFTSGTSGLPKAIMHGSGILLSVSRDFSIHGDAGRGSVWYSMSPVGWVTWCIFNTLLSLQHTVHMFEGVPYFLSPTYFWNLIEECKVTHLTLSASTLYELEKRKFVPSLKHKFESLKVILAGGSVVKKQNYEFIYGKVKKEIVFSSTFASTELLGCCMALETTLPIYKGEIPTACFGVDIEIVDETGLSVVGNLGDIVITKPMPGILIGLWGDTDGSLFREKYFKYSGKFTVGDYGIVNPSTKGYIISCRSDETLIQRGCRFGSSEIYNVVETFPEVRDSLCVSQYNKDKGERAVLFLKIGDGFRFTEELISTIREAISSELTVRHVPDVILETLDIPYNMNGKKIEITVKKIINNMPWTADTIRNPDSLKHYHDILGLEDFQR